jgi:filamentous hemagglutinin family protein
MKIKLQLLVAAFFVLAIYIPAVFGQQAQLTFSGSGGSQFSVTLQNTVTYTIGSTPCTNASIFVFKGVGTPQSTTDPAFQNVTGNITFTVNGGAATPINTQANQFTVNEVMPNDLVLYNAPFSSLPANSTIVLSPGMVTTVNNLNGTLPANGAFDTFIVNSNGVRCASAVTPTAASVFVFGRVTTAQGRSIRNVQITLTDANGNERTAQTTAFGYYHFEEVMAGETVTLSAKARRFNFVQSSIVRTTNESIVDADFVSLP